MWIMTNYGILMPASIPDEIRLALREPWNMQVRSRDRDALRKARKQMKALGSDEFSRIIATPELDYEYRFYCFSDDFALLIATQIRQIDYEKFKPTTERKGGGGRKLHNLYNRIWGVVASHYDHTTTGDLYRAGRPVRSWWDDIHPLDEK